MLNADESKIIATVKIAKLLGVEYVKNHIAESFESYPANYEDDIEYEYFLGFEIDGETKKWTVFARVSVNRETQETIFLDYKTPDGKRMENPIKPVRSA